MDLLDLLTFEDIDEIRQPLLSSKFQQEYEAIIKVALESVGVAEPDAIGLSIRSIMHARERLVAQFRQIFEVELRTFEKRKLREMYGGSGLWKSGVSLGIGLAGFVPDPTVAATAGVFGVLAEGRSLFMNLFRTLRGALARDKHNAYLAAKDKAFRIAVSGIKVSDNTLLLDAVNILSTALKERVSI